MKALLSFAAAVSLACATPVSAQGLPPGFVYLRDVAPSIAQDVRYAGPDNFTGRPLPGYVAAECVLRADAARALAQVAADLAPSGLGLKVYDCYRPMRAVNAMVRWVRTGDGEATRRFFPRTDKTHLIALGYIAARSRHSAGIAVDLTLVQSPSRKAPDFDPNARYGPCNAAAAERAPDDSLDMGTGYDCFDEMSRTRSWQAGVEQGRRRALLAAAMARRGFQNYFREWWHFEFARGAPSGAQDFPIVPR